MGNRASYGFRECDAPTAVYVSEKGLKKMAEGRGDQTDDEVAAMRLLNRGPYGVISRQEDAQLDRMRELDRQHTARSGICKVAFDGLADRITAAIGAARVEPALPEKDTLANHLKDGNMIDDVDEAAFQEEAKYYPSPPYFTFD